MKSFGAPAAGRASGEIQGSPGARINKGRRQTQLSWTKRGTTRGAAAFSEGVRRRAETAPVPKAGRGGRFATGWSRPRSLDELARAHLAGDALPPRLRGVDRRAASAASAAPGCAPCRSFAVHRGEEPPICGTRGSGNVFLAGCNLACRFCQNYPISRRGAGRDL